MKRNAVIGFFAEPSRKGSKRRRPCPAALRDTLRVVQQADEAAPHAAIRCCPALREFSSTFLCFGESQPHSGAHNLAIAPRLVSVGALSDDMMLAASTG